LHSVVDNSIAEGLSHPKKNIHIDTGHHQNLKTALWSANGCSIVTPIMRLPLPVQELRHKHFEARNVLQAEIVAAAGESSGSTESVNLPRTNIQNTPVTIHLPVQL
jgi:hypothetical protein